MALLIAILLAGTVVSTGVDAAHEVALAVRPLSIAEAEHDLAELEQRAALLLVAVDPAFGGFSGMTISADGATLSAISDRGNWLTATLEHGVDGTLESVQDARIGPLTERDGRPISDIKRRDAEELLVLPGESTSDWLVSFEGDHRLWRYAIAGSPPAPTGIPQPLPVPSGITATAPNSGMEAMARLDDDRLVVFTENLRTPGGALRAWVGPTDGSEWAAVTLGATGSFQPTGASTLPNGDVLLLERSFNPLTGVRARLSVLSAADIVPGAVLTSRELTRLLPRHQIDNMEAVATRPGPNGTVLIYLMADDNFRKQQKTVLLQLAWRPRPSATRAP